MIEHRDRVQWIPTFLAVLATSLYAFPGWLIGSMVVCLPLALGLSLWGTGNDREGPENWRPALVALLIGHSCNIAVALPSGLIIHVSLRSLIS